MTRQARILLATLIGPPLCGSAAAHDTHHHAAPVPAESAFLAENRAAMDQMMTDMAVAPTGDVDLDFTAMMIPHHQGAIDMAVAYLRVGTNPQLRRLAQEIIVEQQQEIAAMRLAVGAPLPPAEAAPTGGGPDEHSAAPAALPATAGN